MAILWRFVAAVLVITGPMALTGCTTVSGQEVSTDCSLGPISLDKNFETGAFAHCERLGPSDFQLLISPEDAPPINCSPWYAFRLRKTISGSTPVRVTLEYTACEHRYAPRLSVDGKSWTSVPRDNVSVDWDDRRTAHLEIDLVAEETFVAAQEVLASAHYAAQLERYRNISGVRLVTFGSSRDGRPISGMIVHSGASPPREQVLLIGRQHPPEVTGALAMDAFLDAMMSDHPVAKAYRERFETFVFPLLNPDGVAKGHWRHNSSGKDLNRDWDQFTQPETRSVGQLMTLFDRDPNKKLVLLVDFHSTHRDLIYTIPDELPAEPSFIARDWVARLKQRMPEYEPERISEHNPRLSTAKTQTYVRYQIPTATFEVGDRTDRSLIAKLGREAALALIETMLVSPAPSEQAK